MRVVQGFRLSTAGELNYNWMKYDLLNTAAGKNTANLAFYRINQNVKTFKMYIQYFLHFFMYCFFMRMNRFIQNPYSYYFTNMKRFLISLGNMYSGENYG